MRSHPLAELAESLSQEAESVHGSQIARSPPHFAAVESIDFDLYESKQCLALKAAPRQRMLQSLVRWVAVAMVGVATGCVASGIDYGIVRLTELRFGLMRLLIDKGANWGVLLSVQVAVCTSFAAVAACLVCFVSPLAAGSGIPEVKCRLNGLDLPLVVKPQTLLAKACGVLFSVSAGLPCGKEGPMIHSGSILGSLFARVVFWRFPDSSLQRDLDERDLIAAGGAAGVASAFGAPVGGVLFALEEGASFWNPQVLLQALLSSSLSALTLNFFLGGFDSLGFGTLGALGVLTFGSYFESTGSSYRLWELPLFVALGVAGGLLGATFNALNIPLTLWRMRCVGPGGLRRFVEAVAVAALISVIFFAAPAMQGQCMVTDVKSDAHNALSIICDPGNDAKSPLQAALGLFMTPSEDAIKLLFHDPVVFHPAWLLLFGVIYFALACWTYGLGVPSGLFVPSLLIGSIFGRLLGEVLQGLGGHSWSPPGMYALVGAAASLGGMARITVSLAVILVEATGNTQYSLPVLFAVMTSKMVGDRFNHGIYDVHINLKNMPLLEDPTRVSLCDELVSSVMTQDVQSLHPTESPARLSSILQTSHNAFPLVNSKGSLLGLISRNVLLQLLSSNQEPINLTPFANLGAYSIRDTATVRRAYDLFRSMGLRHLPVVDSNNMLCGILTRKDFLDHCARCTE